MEQNLTLASLAKADTALMTAEIFEELNDDQRQWAATFAHPVLEDLAPNASFYSVGSLPQEQEKLITEQARVVLGFNLGG